MGLNCCKSKQIEKIEDDDDQTNSSYPTKKAK